MQITTQAEKCSLLKNAYKVCRRFGAHALALRCLIRLHEIEDGY